MPIRPPQKPFRIEDVDVYKVSPRQANGLGETVYDVPRGTIQYRDREVIKEVDKIVYKDDPKLLEHLNAVLKENGDLRLRVNKLPKEIQQEPKVVEKFIEINHMVTNVKRELLIAAVSLLTGGLLCYIILK